MSMLVVAPRSFAWATESVHANLHCPAGASSHTASPQLAFLERPTNPVLSLSQIPARISESQVPPAATKRRPDAIGAAASSKTVLLVPACCSTCPAANRNENNDVLVVAFGFGLKKTGMCIVRLHTLAASPEGQQYLSWVRDTNPNKKVLLYGRPVSVTHRVRVSTFMLKRLNQFVNLCILCFQLHGGKIEARSQHLERNWGLVFPGVTFGGTIFCFSSLVSQSFPNRGEHGLPPMMNTLPPTDELFSSRSLQSQQRLCFSPRGYTMNPGLPFCRASSRHPGTLSLRVRPSTPSTGDLLRQLDPWYMKSALDRSLRLMVLSSWILMLYTPPDAAPYRM